MTNELIQKRLKECHERENELNKEISRLDNLIKFSQDRKRAMARRVSKNMVYCNSLIRRMKQL